MARACGCPSGSPASPPTKLPLAITPDQTVGDVARHYPGTLEVMKRMGVNHCCGAQLTLAEAAASVGVSVDNLLATLRGAAGLELSTPRPAALSDTRESRWRHVDVRADIRANREPLAKIMAAVKALAPDEILVLRAPFEPVPLYGVLGKRGLAYWTERVANDDWRVWFYRQPDETSGTDRGAGPAPDPSEPRPRLLDVRGLEPPQPMVRILEELERLEPGQQLEVLHERRPMFLYPQLDERGFIHSTEEPQPGVVRIVIRRGARTG